MRTLNNKNYTSRIWNLLVNIIAGSSIVKLKLRCTLYRLAGLNINTDDIRPGVFFFGPKITIGKRTMINHRCYFENRENIEIGENCRIAMEVMFCTSTHRIGDSTLRGGEYNGKSIKIGNGCWIGTRAIILPGVAIGDGCVVAAGAIVTKDCVPNGLYAGVPAKCVKALD
jgi:maltose O-acetyltransferase